MVARNRRRRPRRDCGRVSVRPHDIAGQRHGTAAVALHGPAGVGRRGQQLLADAGANVESLDERSTQQTGGTFMQRTIFHLPGLVAARDALERDFAEQFASRFAMDFRLAEVAKPKRVAIIASTDDHCLLDLLWRNRRGELDMSVVMVIANHPDLADEVRPFRVPFILMPARKEIRGRRRTAPARPAARQRRSE